MMVEMADYIIAEAHVILSREDVELPAQIESAPIFYVAEKQTKLSWHFLRFCTMGNTIKLV
jgi:hypothetical protein